MKISNGLIELLSDPELSGVYRITGKVDAIETAASSAGLAISKLDLALVHDKAHLLESLSSHLKLPEHFGHNWDALHDLLSDSSWQSANGWVIILRNAHRFANAHKEDFETLVNILKSAAEQRRREKKPLWILVQGAKGWNPGLDPFPAA